MSMEQDRPATPTGPPGRGDLLRGEVAFRLLVDAVQDYAIFLLGPDGRVLTWNLGAERIKGYTADEIIGQHFSVFYTAEEREADRPTMLLGSAAQQGRFEDEGWRVRKDGSRFWADVILTALRDESGQPYAYAKVTRDMTERRLAEQQQRELRIEQEKRAAAEEAIALRDRFLGIAAHELKTPVATLQLGAESLIRARQQGRLDEGRLDTGLQRIRKASGRLGALVEELLDVSRLAGDRVLIIPESTDVVALVREVVARFTDAEFGERLTLSAPDELWLHADPSRLDQVVTNLVDNALKYSDGSTCVEIDVADTGGTVEIRVADRGIGLGAEPAHLFEAFGRGANAEHLPGMGLGLFISQQIVERHGGHIEAVPQDDGIGTVFTVRLPQPVPEP